MFPADYLSKEERGLHWSGAETYWCLCHDGPAASTHQLCGACPFETGGPPCKLSDLIRGNISKHTLQVTNAPNAVFSSQWLNEEKLVQRLTELIHTGKDEEVSVQLFVRWRHLQSITSRNLLLIQQFTFQRQSNASQTLCDIIRLSRDQANQMQENVEVDPLLAVLES